MQEKFDKAINWWKMAAEQGEFASLHNLYTAYWQGKIVAQDKASAYAYLKMAKYVAEEEANQQIPIAEALLDYMRKSMSSDEIVKADTLVSSWKPKPTPLTIRAIEFFKSSEKLVKTRGR